MTTLSNGRLESFKNNVWNTGLDRTRGDVLRRIGTGAAAAAASFREGQPLMLNSSGLLVVHSGDLSHATGSPLAGVASANKMTLGQAVIVNQAVTFSAAGQTRNIRPNVVANSLQARATLDFSGGVNDHLVATAPGANVDFVLNAANGTLQHDAANSNLAPTANAPVTIYVTYAVSLTAADYEFEGRNFFNNLDDVTIQDSKVSVIKAPCSIWTTEFDTSAQWAVNRKVNITADGKFGMVATGATTDLYIGVVLQVPTAGDPYLGIELLAAPSRVA